MKIAAAFVLFFIAFMCIMTYLAGMHGHLMFRPHMTEDWVIWGITDLNRANKINHYEIISEGGMTGTVADARIILRKAPEQEAVNIVLRHNHPSGSLKPSRQDQELTYKIKEAAQYFDIKVLDHIIVSEEGYYSFADDGIL